MLYKRNIRTWFTKRPWITGGMIIAGLAVLIALVAMLSFVGSLLTTRQTLQDLRATRTVHPQYFGWSLVAEGAQVENPMLTRTSNMVWVFETLDPAEEGTFLSQNGSVMATVWLAGKTVTISADQIWITNNCVYWVDRGNVYGLIFAGKYQLNTGAVAH